jgi:putative flippase GtrA
MKKSISDLLKQYRELIRYGIVGVLTTVVSLGSYYLCVTTILDAEDPFGLQAANVISWILAVTFAYFANRIYVFESQNQNRLREAAAFYTARVSTLLLDMGGMFLLVTVFGTNHKIAKLAMQVVILVANYLVSKFMVFRKSEVADKK